MYGKVIKNSARIFLGLTLFISACTDSRSKTTVVRQDTTTPTVAAVTQLTSVGDVKVKVQGQTQNTVAMQLQVRGTSLFVTGRPFGFARWEISPNPEDPIKTFSAGDNIGVFSPTGSWVVENYASGALEISGSSAFMSGTFGLTLINIGNIGVPIEVARKPPIVSASLPTPSDEAYIYKAIIANPSLPMYYGFRQQDYVYTVDTSNIAMNLIRRDSYGANGQNVCCVTSATRFGNRIYVAFRDRVVMFDMAADGRLVAAGSFTGLHAANVVSTPNYLYIQHEPISGIATSMPRGIYVFDSAGNNVDRIALGTNLLRMAVSWDDSHVYGNVDNTSVRIFRIDRAPVSAQ